MSILVNRLSKVLIQGITGHEGEFHARQMIQYGTNIIAGVTPGRGGEWVIDGKVPVFDSAKMAVEATGVDTSVIFVPARFATDAMLEAVDAGINVIVCITEGIPVQDVIRVSYYIKQKGGRLIGPNCPGILTPKEVKVGIIPGDITIPGSIGVVSRSGTLTYEVLWSLKQKGLGCSTCIGIGGDPIIGMNFVDILELFEEDANTDRVVLIGEIGGTDEEKAAGFIAGKMTKPVVAYIAGQTAPAEKRMGHAGAIIEGTEGLANQKMDALQNAGVRIAHHPEEIPHLIGL